MNTVKLICLLFVLALLSFACKKNEPEIYLHGVVIDKNTKSPIPNIEVQIKRFIPGPWGPENVLLLDKTWANSSGEFILKITDINEKYQYKVESLMPDIIDSNNLTCKYIPNEIVVSVGELTNKMNLELEPSGRINFYISQASWDSISPDTIFISSPYVTGQLVKRNHDFYFYVEPSKTCQFSWYYRKNGANSIIITKQIYVPNYYKGNGCGSTLPFLLNF
jgi:hypothetical protein